ncbi:hypothetical protein PDIG_00550 [Penicillium digitatum PHI26]|uniref:Terpenoid synthase n=2 Tax=Penicillium digitatum TaxID=36651 RepID=K9GZ63_PEND2|nr:hypothetical protein PDIP_02810 [Penicillium digitatum Pd1]EKV19888.1 hypothetical protein PDIG_00550 [Penicillium digitatum PHI26]EKV21804.1 hypothetical protein PDIP_02810 [Penicillium digitatum Pd1]KAG0154649.1 hypothetical protein PDIDSM_217 [Penicillium digitatum]
MATCDYLSSQHDGIVSPLSGIRLPNNVTGKIPIYKRLNEEHIPDYNIVLVDSVPQSAVISSHAKFKASINPENAGDAQDFHESCFAEAATVNLLFPDVRSESIRICLAAWLAAICTADDLLEAMPPAAATANLKELILKFQGRKADVSATNKLASIFLFFIDHCNQQLDLDESISRQLNNDLCNICESWLDELRFRQGILPNNFETYMQFRGKTMAIQPFFTLMRTMYKPIEGEYLSGLQDLLNQISLVLGLQNDLVGLEKDRRDGETMNAVLLSLKEKAEMDADHMEIEFRRKIEEICDLHNLYVSAAVEMYQALHVSMNEDAHDPTLETAILALADTHLKWCTSYKRYQAKIE